MKLRITYVFIIGLSLLLFISRLFAAEYTIRQLSNNTYQDQSPQIHKGQVAWLGDINEYYIFQVFFYNGKQIIQLTNSPYYNTEPQIHNGQVVWSGYDGSDTEIFFYNGKQTLQLTNNDYTDSSPQINNGQVVWYGYSDIDSEIFFYDGSRVIQLTDNDYRDSKPQIDNGQIVWESPIGIFLYDGKQTIQLGNGMSPQIHNGQAVWSGYTGGNVYEIFFYDGSQIIQLTDNDYWDGDPQIDNGQVTWESYKVVFLPGGNFLRIERDVFFFDGSQTIKLTEMPSSYYCNPQIHNGMVTWESNFQTSIINREIFVYDGKQRIRLTYNKGRVDGNPQIHNGQIVWNGYDGNDMEIFLAQPALEILDGVDFSSGREVSSDPEKLVAIKGVEAEGAVTDGVTRLLLKLEVDEPNTAAFSLEGTGNPKEDGLLRSLDGSQEGSSIIVNSVNTSQGEKAFAIYQAPESFVRQNYSEDRQASERRVLLKVKYNGIPPFELSKEIKLVRPPVILIHGLWSGPEMWDEFEVMLKNKIPGIQIFTVNYKGKNSSYLLDNTDVPYSCEGDSIQKAKEKFKSDKIAMVQADVLGHSMGGVLSRIWAGLNNDMYKRDNNFGKGDINKLITLDSPHFGSFIADLGIGLINRLEEEERNLLLELAEEKGFSLDKGAVEDLMTKSPKIIYMNGISTDDTASHAIIGDVSRDLDSLKGSGALLYIILASIEYNTGDNILPDESDLVVSTNSQAGGLVPPTSSTFSHWHCDATGEEVVDKTVELLNAEPDSEVFNGGFPIDQYP